MSFDPETWCQGAHGDARRLGMKLLELADEAGHVELSLRELRRLVSTNPESADKAIWQLRALRKLAMVTKPSQRGGRARWELTTPHSDVVTTKTR